MGAPRAWLTLQDRSGLHPSDGNVRRRLAPLVDALYRGATIDICGRQMCYRGRGELMPDLPRARSPMRAVEPGLFLCAEVTAGRMVVDQRWLHSGALDELEATLARIKAPADIAEQVQLQLSFRSCLAPGGAEMPIEVTQMPHVRTQLTKVAIVREWS
jgi:hypothetical protein